MAYHVKYRVTGSVLGARELTLTDGDSKRPKSFASLEEAEGEVALLSRINRPLSTVNFQYWAVPAQERI